MKNEERKMKNKEGNSFLSFLYYLFFCICVFSTMSCTRVFGEKPVQETVVETSYAAEPAMILQPGRNPLWFKLTDEGPVLIETIEDVVNTVALAPWPLALHVRFSQEKDNEIVSVINRYGFMKLAVSDTFMGIDAYTFSGGEYWRQYTVGGFIFYDDKPAALLYLDDRFLDTDAPVPNPRTWTFSMDYYYPYSIDIPVLDSFPIEEGWGADVLRHGSDGFWYYRVYRRSGSQPGIRLLRTDSLTKPGNDVTAEVFHSSAPLATEIINPSLPRLPNGFHYTWMGRVGDSLFASWEEQVEFNIGAAGFVVIKR